SVKLCTRLFLALLKDRPNRISQMNLPLYTLAIVLAIFVLLFAVEKLFPLRESHGGLVARLIVNVLISALAFLVAALVVRPSALRALNWASEKHFGLLHLLPLSSWAQVIVGFLLLDLSFYYWHILNH